MSLQTLRRDRGGTAQRGSRVGARMLREQSRRGSQRSVVR